MKMTPEGARAWVLNPETPDRLIADALQSPHVADWPLPRYLWEELEALSVIENPNQTQVDDVRIPLKNWFRQRREEIEAERTGTRA